MRNEEKMTDSELQLFKERAALCAVFFVTLILAALASHRFGFSSDYNPLIALSTTFLALSAYLYQLKKNKKDEVIK